MNIIIGNDHAAVDLKKQIMDYLTKQGHSVTNIGVDTSDSMDYPDIAEKTCKEYNKGSYDFGIVCCGTGIGISISANKVKGIRCAPVCDSYSAKMAKAHNNANFIAFGSRINYSEPIENIIEAFISTEFEGGRHGKRVDKMMSLENESTK